MKLCGEMFPGFPETCELEHGHASEWHRAGVEENDDGSRRYRIRWNDEERRELKLVELHTTCPGYNVRVKL